MRKKLVFLAVGAVAAVLFFNASSTKATSDEIVVSIKPLHSLVCALAKGITNPTLLLDGNSSPHHVQLVPSQVLAMKNAKILIWVGPAYEQPLFKHVKQLENNVLTLQDDSSIKLKPLRSGTFWDEKSCCAHDHHKDHDHHHHEKSDATNPDGHIWLDPLMMTQVVDVVLQHLKKLYPNHQGLLSRNANDYKKRLEVLHQDLLKKMKPYKGKTYIIQHDGNQYFDNAYKVKTIATISIDPSIPPSAGHILKIRKAISDGKIHPRCLYAERQLDGALARSYADTLKLPFAVVDYLGADVPAGEDAYEALMNAYVNAFIEGIK
jgi:zinc transport system substrate-binding protein